MSAAIQALPPALRQSDTSTTDLLAHVYTNMDIAFNEMTQVIAKVLRRLLCPEPDLLWWPSNLRQFCFLNKSLRTGDVLTTHNDNITGIVSRIRNNHVEGPLSPKTSLTVDSDRKNVTSIRFISV